MLPRSVVCFDISTDELREGAITYLSRVDPVMGDALAQAVKDYPNVQRVRIKTFDEPDPTRWDFETDR